MFYLHHRVSNDLDFFTAEDFNLPDISRRIKMLWREKAVVIKQNNIFLSLLINNVKVDFVIDKLSNKEKRNKIKINDSFLTIDTINNIVSNKLWRVVGRTELKDFIDFYFIIKTTPTLDLDNIYEDAKKKDAIFEDVPTVAFQIEENFNTLFKNYDIFPVIHKEFDKKDFKNFFIKLIRHIYKKFKT